MGSGKNSDKNEIPAEDEHAHYVMVEKDKMHICPARTYLPFEPTWSILDYLPKGEYVELNLPRCQLHPVPHEVRQMQEWAVFTHWLLMNKKVAIVKSESCEFYILPPENWKELSHVEVLYRVKDESLIPKYPEIGAPGHTPVALKLSRTDVDSFPCGYVGDLASVSHPIAPMDDCDQKKIVKTSPSYLKTLGQAHAWAFGAIAELVDNSWDAGATTLDIHVESLYLKKTGQKVPVLSIIDDGRGMSHSEILRMLSLGHKQPGDEDPNCIGRFGIGFKTGSMKLGRDVIVLTQTSSSRSVALLSQTLNEDNDNLEIPIITYSRDEHYMEVDLNIQSEEVATYYLKMIKDFSPFNEYSIGKQFGFYSDLGMVTQIYIWNLDEWGSDYTLEWDATGTVDSASHQRCGDIHIRSRRVRSRIGQTSRKSEEVATYYLKMMKDFSPFNEYSIGKQFGFYSDLGMVTQIYIWNLDEWGSDYTLEWDATGTVDSASHQRCGDIHIRSRRVRSRIGQTSRKVPLDYSLKSYLEVIFIDSRMTIYVQDSLVKSRSLAKTLSQTVVMEGQVMNKSVQLTLGWSQEECERANCGIFLYWHGRLIEAYKRVGGMIHSSDMGRGVIGVVDVSDIMDDENGEVWVLNNKQGFRDCEAYTKLLDWLGNKANEYWDKNFELFYLGNRKNVPDHVSVQCNKCRQWRILNTDLDIKTLRREWYCYMPPFNGNCETPEQEVERRVITAYAKRSCSNIQEVNNRNKCNKQQKSVRLDGQLSRNTTTTTREKGNRWYSRPSNHNNNVGGYNRWESWDSRMKNAENSEPNYQRRCRRRWSIQSRTFPRINLESI